MRKVLSITGIRSEYYILRSILKALKKHSFDVKVVACSAHLSEWHGYTLKDIYQDGFEVVDKIDSLFMTDRLTQRPKNVGILTYSLSQVVERENPDFLLVVGDREEAIATAIVGNYMNKLVVHFGGGDPVFGNADDPVRFAVSKLSHIHLVSTEIYRQNLIKIGEEEFRIFNVGNPIYTEIYQVKEIDLHQISKYIEYDISYSKYGVIIKHPLSSEALDSYKQMKISLQAIKEFANKYNVKFIGIYPNTDPGSYGILKAIEEEEDGEYIKFFKTLSFEVFVNILRNAKVLVGNSSMGILEAPFYKLPVVNIGRRQTGRLNAGNVEFVDYDHTQIIKGLEKAVFDKQYRDHVRNIYNPFGDHTNAYKIPKILEEIDITDNIWYIKRKLC
jgi:GDP/UDP-N,N'-diacetylbacillosamine 2-epimerase (hydrolysing)